ncbi:type II secretion system F family protein [Lipingzhangella sp. LS1_29]|uniref:Type II secretion system F family protein n=1 Tax=Lipingzhangella rawalii TaxID=2055835 RepID=A0ABU2H7Y0_9ACTN|nr:type II secretion system F family protein [Lipingzhangella rawalii]MDS1270954.1 type II secretion system F family protein [Lipingzhangella rawalii]
MLLQVLALVGSLAVLGLLVWALWDLLAVRQQRRMLAARSALSQAEVRANSPMARLDTVLRRTELGRSLGRRLARSGVSVRVSTFVVSLVASAISAVVLLWFVLAPLFGTVAAVGVGMLFFVYLQHRERRRREEFTRQLPELTRVLSNATSAGLALPTAIDMAAEEMAAPASEELQRMAQSMKLGQPLDEALAELRNRMPSRELGVLTGTLLVASRSGGSLVTALRGLSGTLEERNETRREVQTILTESTATSWFLVATGVGVLFLINWMQPQALENMSTTLAGQVVLGLVISLYVVGLLVIRRITKFDF